MSSPCTWGSSLILPSDVGVIMIPFHGWRKWSLRVLFPKSHCVFQICVYLTLQPLCVGLQVEPHWTTLEDWEQKWPWFSIPLCHQVLAVWALRFPHQAAKSMSLPFESGLSVAFSGWKDVEVILCQFQVQASRDLVNPAKQLTNKHHGAGLLDMRDTGPVAPHPSWHVQTQEAIPDKPVISQQPETSEVQGNVKQAEPGPDCSNCHQPSKSQA